MKIWIELVFLESESDLFQIDIDINDKLKDIKNKLIYYPSEQTWYLNNKLDDEFCSWNTYDIYQVYIKENWMNIKILANGEEYILKMFKPSYTVYDIKLRIFDIIKVIPPNITLIFNNQVLENTRTLRSYSIMNNSELNIVLKLKTG